MKRVWRRFSDTSMLEGMIAQILADNQDSVQAYLGGKTKLKGFFTGQIMRQTKGKANPKVVNQMLDAALEAQREGVGDLRVTNDE